MQEQAFSLATEDDRRVAITMSQNMHLQNDDD
jgi:uncharacterized protein